MSFRRGHKRHPETQSISSKKPKSLSSIRSSGAISRVKNGLNTKSDRQQQSRTGAEQSSTSSDETKATSSDGGKQKARKGGLDVEIHPLLRDIVPTPMVHKNHNPLKNTKRAFDPLSINPYLDQSNFALASETQHKPRPLNFNAPGKYKAQGDELRQRLKEEEEEKRRLQGIKERGLEADEMLGEGNYKPSFPPSIEWWDRPYHKSIHYDEEFVLDNETSPVTSYIQHPVIISPLWERNVSQTQSMYLTKAERKRLRRNKRQEQLKEKQNRIRLGLDPPPPPKVRLSNLMNVLTNEAIRDPTAIEQQVRKETEDRIRKHYESNAERQLSKDERHEKTAMQHEKDKEKGVIACVFKIPHLVNRQHMYKIDINAKQLHLVGLCIKNPKFSLVLVEGGRKAIEFYKKLLTRRIKWTENNPPEDLQEESDMQQTEHVDLSDNRCDIIWEGPLQDFRFKKWSIIDVPEHDALQDLLLRFRIEEYWKMALTSEN